jgi:hypothetical protein
LRNSVLLIPSCSRFLISYEAIADAHALETFIPMWVKQHDGVMPAESSSSWRGKNFDLAQCCAVVLPCIISQRDFDSALSAGLVDGAQRLQEIRTRTKDLIERRGVLIKEIQSLLSDKQQSTAGIAPTIWSRVRSVKWVEWVSVMLVVCSTALIALAM